MPVDYDAGYDAGYNDAIREIRCSVTVMPISKDGKIGFIRRDKNDSLGGLLVAAGGKVERTDGTLIDGIPYFSVEAAAVREFFEETGLTINLKDLHYFASLTLPDGKIVVSMYVNIGDMHSDKLIFLTRDDINANPNDFVAGMRQEALMLYDYFQELEF
jgi:8-oxo-dGTP pyrophosphatase MutT (NUDIX family)